MRRWPPTLTLRTGLRPFPDVAVLTEDYERAAQFHNRFRDHGIAGTSIELLICAVAGRLPAPVYTLDRDFVHYARVLGVTLHAPR